MLRESFLTTFLPEPYSLTEITDIMTSHLQGQSFKTKTNSIVENIVEQLDLLRIYIKRQ
jgi:hypothetical protein